MRQVLIRRGIAPQRKGGIFEGGQIEPNTPGKFMDIPGAAVPANMVARPVVYRSTQPTFVQLAVQGLGDAYVGTVPVGGPQGNVFAAGAAPAPYGGATARGGVFESPGTPDFVVLEQTKTIGTDPRTLPPYTPQARAATALVRSPVRTTAPAQRMVPFNGCCSPDGLGR